MSEKKYTISARLIINFDTKPTVTWNNLHAHKIRDSLKLLNCVEEVHN